MQINIQISSELFVMIDRYFNCDLDDNQRAALGVKIRRGIADKWDAILRREFYSDYKTADNDEQRETARQLYLDKSGIPADFRW